MKTKIEIRDWILKNCVISELGEIDLEGLDFSDYDGIVNISHMKTKGDLMQDSQKVIKGDLYQDSQEVIEGDLHQREQEEVKGKVYQYCNRAHKTYQEEYDLTDKQVQNIIKENT